MQERRRSDCQFSKLNTQPACTPLFTLRSTPRDALRKTRCRVVRYSFLVGLFHFLLHAGLSRRTALACGATIDPGTAADSHGIQSRTAPTICSVAAESRNRQMRQPETYAAHGLEAVPTASLCACDSVTARRNGAMAHLELGRAYTLYREIRPRRRRLTRTSLPAGKTPARISRSSNKPRWNMPGCHE
jgi:hypothetical protein